MAKTAASTTISPLQFAPGNPIYMEDLGRVAQMQTYAWTYRRQIYLSINAGDESAGFVASGTAVNIAPHNPQALTGSYQTIYRGQIYINPSYSGQTISAYFACYLASSATAAMQITIDGNSASCSATTSGATSTAANVTGYGTGWVDYTLEFRNSAGTGTAVLGEVIVYQTVTSTPAPALSGTL